MSDTRLEKRAQNGRPNFLLFPSASTCFRNSLGMCVDYINTSEAPLKRFYPVLSGSIRLEGNIVPSPQPVVVEIVNTPPELHSSARIGLRAISGTKATVAVEVRSPIPQTWRKYFTSSRCLVS